MVPLAFMRGKFALERAVRILDSGGFNDGKARSVCVGRFLRELDCLSHLVSDHGTERQRNSVAQEFARIRDAAQRKSCPRSTLTEAMTLFDNKGRR